MAIRYAHTNIIAKDWKRLSRFYQRVFGCTPVPPERDLKGAWVDAFTGLRNAHITGEHLALPGYEGAAPTLEIFSYDETEAGGRAVNREGLAHLAFEVDDVEAVLQLLLLEGGSQIGELVRREYPNGMIATLVYAADPEGNILELQKWEKA